jgi:Tol biopolymer transport system component
MITFVATDSQSQTNLWVRRLSSNDAKLLTGTDKAQYPFWSPDSRAIGFFADGKLKTIDRDGGPVLSIADAPFGRGGAWTPAGQIIFAPNLSDARLFSVPATGGPVKTALAFDTSLHRMPRYPELLPDGNKLLVALLEIPSNSADVYVAGLDGSAPVKLLTDCSYPRYASGYLFYVRQGILMAQQLDPSSLKLTGAPVAIQDHVDMWAARAKADYSLSENGMLLYSAAATAKSNELIFMHIDGSEEVVGQFDQFRSISSSPDDSQVAYEVIDMTKSLTSIWIYNFATKVQSQLTFGGNGAGNPVWSRDGRAIYLNEEVGPSKASIFVLSADGSGNKELVARGEEGSPIGYYPQDISPDGRYLIVCLKSESAGELGMVDLGAQARPLPVRKLGVKGINARFSPDGRWIVYESDEGGSAKIYVSSFPAKPGMWQVSADGSEPLWGTNQLSYYSRSRDRYEAVDVTLTSGTPVFGPPHPLFSGGKSQSVFIFGVTHDGKRYLAFRPVNSGANVGLSLVVNWKGLLESEKH